MAYGDWRRYYMPIVSAGVIHMPFLKRSDLRLFCRQNDLILIGIGSIKAKDIQHQHQIWQHALINSELYRLQKLCK